MNIKMGRAVAIGIVGVTVVAGAAAAAPKLIQSNDDLTDFALSSDQATDGARAHVMVEATDSGGTRVRLQVTGLEQDAVGRTLGAHVHRGPCVEGNSAAASTHYRSDALPATPTNEVWLDFVVQPGGVGFADTTVPFAIPTDQAGSVVIHEMATDPATPNGFAGGRYACITVDF